MLAGVLWTLLTDEEPWEGQDVCSDKTADSPDVGRRGRSASLGLIHPAGALTRPLLVGWSV